MNTDWPSTKALSVHNALRISGRAMTRQELVGFLQRGHHPSVGREYVDIGIAFLLQRGFVECVGPLIVSRVDELTRADEDRELEPAFIRRAALDARK